MARKDILFSKVVTLDTTHLLRSALNEEAPLKAVVFGRRKKKGSDVKWTKIKQQRTTTITLGKEKRTFAHVCHT